jgi:hypothetical protein
MHVRTGVNWSLLIPSREANASGGTDAHFWAPPGRNLSIELPGGLQSPRKDRRPEGQKTRTANAEDWRARGRGPLFLCPFALLSFCFPGLPAIDFAILLIELPAGWQRSPAFAMIEGARGCEMPTTRV